MRNWDARTGAGVDEFMAISRFVARRIRKVYRRESTVIYPPVDTDAFSPDWRQSREPFYLTASRMVPYKRLDLITEAFSGMPERSLVIIGDGPEAARIRGKAAANVRLLGRQPQSVLLDHLRRARAFVFAAEEDFGIAPLEAQACGTPVIAFQKGGAVETIHGLDHARPTGVFFAEQTVASLQGAVTTFEREAARIAPADCHENALRFRADRFRSEFGDFVRDRYARFREGIA
jgi:glycosyltransferase involved in cell wall biosynthesis